MPSITKHTRPNNRLTLLATVAAIATGHTGPPLPALPAFKSSGDLSSPPTAQKWLRQSPFATRPLVRIDCIRAGGWLAIFASHRRDDPVHTSGRLAQSESMYLICPSTAFILLLSRTDENIISPHRRPELGSSIPGTAVQTTRSTCTHLEGSAYVILLSCHRPAASSATRM